MTKVWISRHLPERVEARAHARFDATTTPSTTPLGPDALARALRENDGVLATLGDGFTPEVFAAAGQIRARVIANFGVGYNHIDVEAARARDITVTNTPGVLTEATADIAMTLMLMVARRAGEGERLARSGAWPGWHPTQMLGQDVTGRTLGIIGFGRIGQAMARKAHFGFGMKVIYYNRSPKAVDFPAVRLETIAEVMAEADIVALHTPGGGANTHLIGKAELAAMKPTGILVNTARGDVIDEAALMDTLERGAIFGAGLDVYEHEPHVPNRLRTLDNVVLLPHLGSATLGVREAMGNMALDNLEAFFAGRPVPNPV
ncbi:MAG: D-glycerate dehydrogenase [Pseudomonadota bacterium]